MKERLYALLRWLETDSRSRIAGRPYVDTGPILERDLARLAGLGWFGKNTMLIHPRRGSFLFLGALFVDVELEPDAPFTEEHCGTCRRCIDACPTAAIADEGVLDATRCISYLTIEHDGPIPEELRAPMGNRIYGCDDCQLVCPWNKYAQRASLADFDVREAFDAPTLLELWRWDEAQFLQRTEGSAIRRIGYERWLRNIAIALGNAPTTPTVTAALHTRRDSDNAVVREHVEWALGQHAKRGGSTLALDLVE